jgi:putative transposase
VILENHLHMIASAPEISAVMQSFKSYTARQIIDLLKSRGSETLLRQLA